MSRNEFNFQICIFKMLQIYSYKDLYKYINNFVNKPFYIQAKGCMISWCGMRNSQVIDRLLVNIVYWGILKAYL